MPFEEAGHSFEPGDDEHDTPEPFFQPFHDILGGFDLDPCASDTSNLADRNVTKDEDGMSIDWWGDVWFNPRTVRWATGWITASDRLRLVTARISSRSCTPGRARSGSTTPPCTPT